MAFGADIFTANWVSLLKFSIIININLAIFNLLPFPPLDGGRLLFCVIEKIHKPFLRFQQPITTCGAVLLLGLMLYVTVLDVGRLVIG